MKAVFLNNMLTPYTNALFNKLYEDGLDFEVISCTNVESNRGWGNDITPKYIHSVLKGVSVRLAQNRFAHLNTGIARALTRARPDALILNGFYPSMLVGALWALFNRVPIGLTIDGWAKNMPSTPYHLVFRRFILRRCKAIITCSKKGMEYFLSQGAEGDSIFLAPLIPGWKPILPIAPFESRQFDLLWVAQINRPVKNGDFVLSLINHVHNVLPQLRVLIVGDGPFRETLLKCLEGRGVSYVHKSHVPWYEMEAIYANAKVLILPSLQEPWGLVCNEAMICGTPCIVSPNVGAADDLVVNDVSGHVIELNECLWAQECLALVSSEDRWAAMSAESVVSASGRTLAASAQIVRAAVEKIAEHYDDAK